MTVTIRTELRFPVGGGSYFVVTGADIEAGAATLVAMAASETRTLLTPPSKRQLQEWLAGLQSVCAAREDDLAKGALALANYVDGLRQFPTDVVKDVLSKWRTRPGNGPNWWPTLRELTDECERAAQPRRAMLHALESWSPGAATIRQMEDEADGWLRDAYRADEDMLRTRKSDPDASSKFAEFAVHARAEYKRLIVEAREAE